MLSQQAASRFLGMFYRVRMREGWPWLNAMAAWVLECTNCKTRFEHERIDDAGIINYFHPQKPNIPADGVELVCPKCGGKARYFFFDLRYRS
jgi:hypothetical protein